MATTLDTTPAASIPAPAPAQAPRIPYGALALVGLGGLFAGITGPLLSNFIPPMVRDVVGDRRTLIGGIMAIDNVLLLLLVPWAGTASDRAVAAGRGRLSLVVAGFLLAAVGMVALPWTAGLGLVALVPGLVLLHAGINIQRAPFQALLADAVPSRVRSLATGSVTFQMCVGAIVFLMLGRALGMRPAFVVAGVTVAIIAALLPLGLRGAAGDARPAHAEVTFASLLRAAADAVRGVLPGVRAIFLATLLLQMTFQTFTTWYALHATERFGVRAEDVTLGFIAWAVGGVIGALPAGVVGMRLGRRNAMLAGFALMGVCLVALDRATQLTHTVPLLALASAAWTFPMVNAWPLFIEPVKPTQRGVLAALFLLCMAFGGGIGDPLNGWLFDVLGGYGSLFRHMAVYTALAVVAVLLVPRGTGEASPVATAAREA